MYSFFSQISRVLKFKFIEVYGLYGKSGTGKSFNAFNIMEKYNINTLIDDGILIHHGSIVAGRSAKKSQTQMEAVRRAIFVDDAHKEEIEKAIQTINPKKILIIGTSPKMISKIVIRLGLQQPTMLININDITTEADRAAAQYFRNVENKHVIPVPAIQISKTFPGGLVGYIEHFFSKKNKQEQAVVRPAYNAIGNIVISKIVIIKYIRIFFSKFDAAVLKHFQLSYNKHIDKGISIKLYISVKFGTKINELSKTIQTNLKNYIEFYIGLEVNKIDVYVIEIL